MNLENIILFFCFILFFTLYENTWPVNKGVQVNTHWLTCLSNVTSMLKVVYNVTEQKAFKVLRSEILQSIGCCWSLRTEFGSAAEVQWPPGVFSRCAVRETEQFSPNMRPQVLAIIRKDFRSYNGTCCAPLSLLSVLSSSKCVTQSWCRAARSRARSVLKCSVGSGSSGTSCK